jgi:ABC-type sugar transport system permease subunit
MSTAVDEGAPADRGSFSYSLSAIIFRLIGLTIIDVFALWYIYNSVLIGGTAIFVATGVAIITIMVNAAFLREKLYPFRWLSPSLAIIILMVLYPVLFTTFLAFTNNGTGHLLSKQQAIEQIEKVQYVPEGGVSFTWTSFRSDGNDFILWVIPDEGEPLLLGPDTELIPEEAGVQTLDANGIPESIPGYTRLQRGDNLRYLAELGELEFGEVPNTIKIRSLDEAAPLQQRYVYDGDQDVMVDQVTGEVYFPVRGTFTSAAGDELRPGYYVFIGLENFLLLFSSPAFRGPFLIITLWTFVHAFMAVLLTFSLGLFFAVVYNDDTLPGRKLIRSLLLIPYAIPAFISVMMWRGLLNQNFGVISNAIEAVFGTAPAWFASPFWAKVGILMIQLWLGYPYMMLICTGALQAIPGDIYEAAEVDGASTWYRFKQITLPLLLVAVGPLLIASFAFNFNNFTVIDVYNEGGPPIPNSPTQAGFTDILITYTYRLAFASGRGIDYGYASAITIIMFLILAIVTIIQFRYTQNWEEVSENV